MNKRFFIINAILVVFSDLSPMAEIFAQEGYVVENIKHNYGILVEPQRSEIYSGEQTSISIDVHEFDTAGQLECNKKEETIVTNKS